MNLRQRVAWLCLALYLASSLAIVYYLFDVADQFTLFSVEHSRIYHSSQSTSSFSWRSFWEHLVADLPLPLVLLLMFLLYTHGFATLFYLTLPQASSKVNKCLIPVLGWFYLFQRMRALCQREQSSEEELSGSHYVISIS